MSSKGTPAALMVASLYLMGTGASGAPVFTTVVLDDFQTDDSYQEYYFGWSARIGPEGHVAYFGSLQLRVWDGSETVVLHRVGGGLNGLKPIVRTGIYRGHFGERPDMQGQILGIDRYGGVSAVFWADYGPIHNAWILASTTLDGDFRAIVAPEHLAEDPAVIRSRPQSLWTNPRRTASGATFVFDTLSTATRFVSTLRVFTPELAPTTIAATNSPPAGHDAEIILPYAFSSLYRTPSGGSLFDIADSGGVVFGCRFSNDAWATEQNAVARRMDGDTQLIVRSDVSLGGVMMSTMLLFPNHPVVRINNSGDTVLAGWFIIDGSPETRALLLSEAGSEAPQVVAEFGQPLHLSNYSSVVYDPSGAFGNGVSHALSIAEDGSFMFGVTLGYEPYSPAIVLRNSSGEMRMLLAPDPDLLSVNGSVRHDWPPPIVSLDGTSAATEYFVDEALTVFHASPASLTRVLSVGDLLEVAPGDARLVTDTRLLDVYGQRVLVSADFDDGTRGMFSVFIPECRADMNRDGVVDADDFFLYLQLFAAGDPRADINHDGVINADDFFEYLDLFAAGC
ncbi:MAG: hypothetical protein JJU33_04860 [Phycisphaerales bacterium]|nr:hypothetical protein [Phycisphaerales bacterium]